MQGNAVATRTMISAQHAVLSLVLRAWGRLCQLQDILGFNRSDQEGIKLNFLARGGANKGGGVPAGGTRWPLKGLGHAGCGVLFPPL